MIPLSRWFEAPRGADPTVAFGREGERSLGDLRRDVGSLAARIASARGGDLLVQCDDAYAFAVGLLASAHVGARAILPPSRQAGALRDLGRGVVGAILDVDDPPAALADRPCWHALEAASDSPACAFAPLDRDAAIAVLSTSGTTGSGRRIVKAVRHLEDEIAVLEQCFGAELGAHTRILATVAPQHLYGLLFRVLWPLAAGRPFLRSAVLHPEELAPHSGDASPFAVVTTPVTLRHLVERGELARRREACRAVFSSGGPLGDDLSRRAAEALGRTPWEIYGSTETGGVAVRRQRRGGEPWQPMPGVAIAVDAASGCLAVTSPFASAGEDTGGGRARFVTGDRAELCDTGTFRLLGRADRVIKVGEKRLSLPDMEERLRAHPAVAEAALLALGKAAKRPRSEPQVREAGFARLRSRRATPSPAESARSEPKASEDRTGLPSEAWAPAEMGPGEPRVAAVVVPSAAAWDAMATGGRRALAKALSEHLAPDFERVLLPRAWRFVAALPRDVQGKLPEESLRALFASDTQPSDPVRLAARRDGAELEVHLRIPWDLTYLDGHFPGSPVVAGVAQVHFAMRALEELLGDVPVLATLEALKFHDLLLPGQEARLRVGLSEGGARFRFSLADAERPERLFASGRGAVRRKT